MITLRARVLFARSSTLFRQQPNISEQSLDLTPTDRKTAKMASKRKSDVDDSPMKKKTRRYQTFRKEYTEKWSFIKPGRKGDSFAFCDVCANDFSVKSGGRDDCRRHVETEKHKNNTKSQDQTGSNKKITGFFQAKAETSTESTDVIRAEVMMVDLAVELNLPMAALDKVTKAVKIMFKDSEIAKKFQCGRSKGTAITKEIAAQTSLNLA